MQKNRVAFFDNCKFILMALVVVGHFLDQNTQDYRIYRSLFLFIYSFHMPLFFFISGLFDKAETPMSKRLNKSVYYLSLYFILKAVITLIQWAFTGKIKFVLFTEVGIPWFCLVMAVYVLATGLLAKAGVNRWVFFAVSVALACFAGFDKSLGDFLCLSRIIIFYPFYLFGTLIPRDKLLNVIKKPWLRILGIAVLLGFLAVCIFWVKDLYFLRKLFTGRNPFADSYRSFGPLVRLGCYALTGVVGFAFLLAVPQRNLGKLTAFGQRSMQVYFWHRPVLYVIVYLHLNSAVLNIGVAGRILWIVLALILTLILSTKLFSFPTEHLSKWLTRQKKN